LTLHHVRVGAIVAAALPAVAIAAPPAGAQAPASIQVRDSSLRYGERAVVTGRVPAGPVTLELRSAGEAAFVPVASATAGSDGRYRLAVRLSRSGTLRVVTPATASAERKVRVAARVGTRKRRLNVRAGRSALVTGQVRRPVAGRLVALQARSGGRWRTLDRDRTDASGRYRLRHRTRGTRSDLVRVRFGGDALNAPSRRVVGRLNAFRPTVASWYGPGFYGRRTACGITFRASLRGVAHKSLPCGTRVTLRRGSRVVRARVIDRGPFIPGREFDVSPAIRSALRMPPTARIGVAY
jgi:rare lipoprotein A